MLPGRILHTPIFYVADAQRAVGLGHLAFGRSHRHGEQALLQRRIEAAEQVVAIAIAEAVALVFVDQSAGFAVGVETDEKGERVGAKLGGALS